MARSKQQHGTPHVISTTWSGCTPNIFNYMLHFQISILLLANWWELLLLGHLRRSAGLVRKEPRVQVRLSERRLPCNRRQVFWAWNRLQLRKEAELHAVESHGDDSRSAHSRKVRIQTFSPSVFYLLGYIHALWSQRVWSLRASTLPCSTEECWIQATWLLFGTLTPIIACPM